MRIDCEEKVLLEIQLDINELDLLKERKTLTKEFEDHEGNDVQLIIKRFD